MNILSGLYRDNLNVTLKGNCFKEKICLVFRWINFLFIGCAPSF